MIEEFTKMKKEILLSSLVTIVSLAIAFAAGFFTNQFINPPELELPILSEAQRIIKNHSYYGLPTDPKLEYGMIHGMVGALDDPYASFVEPVQHELSTDSFKGEFGGIGAEVSLNEEQRIVLFPLPDSPALEAGIEDGDILVGVDGVPITPELDVHTVVSMVRGPEGENVTITIQRPPEMSEFEFKIKRKIYTLPSVTWKPVDNYPQIGIIDVNIIAATTADEISEAITDLSSQKVEFFILDLRGNGGGILDSGINIAKLFLSEGEIILHQQYKGSDEEVQKSTADGKFKDIPLVILIDQASASASEIIAGALQTNARAVLIGLPSYGKNTIQLVFTLDDESSIHVTSAVWWLDGKSPDDHFQLIPDIQPEQQNPSPEEIIQLAVEYFLGE